MKRIIGITAILFCVPFVAFAENSGTFVSTKVAILSPPPVKHLLVINSNESPWEPVFSVSPDGTTFIRGVNVAQMSSDEARVAMVTLTRWILDQQRDEGMLRQVGRQTEYLLRRLEECERR